MFYSLRLPVNTMKTKNLRVPRELKKGNYKKKKITNENQL